MFLWLAWWTYIGIGILMNAPRQIKKDQSFILEKIKPSVDFIEGFKKKHERLPTKREFYTWEREYYKDYGTNLNEPIDSLISGNISYIKSCSDLQNELSEEHKIECKSIDWSKDYMISVWRGEWNEYYLSWENLYKGNGYSLKDGFIALVVNLCIGFIPMLIWWISRR